MVRKKQVLKRRLMDFFRVRKGPKRGRFSENSFLSEGWRPSVHMSRWQKGIRAFQTKLIARTQRKQFACPPKPKALAFQRKKIALATGLVGLVMVLFFCAPNILSTFIDKAGYARVEKINITGNEFLASSDIYRKSGLILYQTKIFDIDEAELVRQIKELAWVDDVVVEMGFSSVVDIRVKEQKPVALIHNAGEENSFSYLGCSGNIFTQVKQGASLDYPVITGLSLVDEDVVDESLKNVLSFLKKLARNNPNFPVHSLSEIHVAENGKLTLYLVDYSFPIYVGDTEIKYAYKWLVQILSDIYARPRGIELANIGYIQLDYMKDRVLVAENGSS